MVSASNAVVSQNRIYRRIKLILTIFFLFLRKFSAKNAYLSVEELRTIRSAVTIVLPSFQPEGQLLFSFSKAMHNLQQNFELRDQFMFNSIAKPSVWSSYLLDVLLESFDKCSFWRVRHPVLPQDRVNYVWWTNLTFGSFLSDFSSDMHPIV